MANIRMAFGFWHVNPAATFSDWAIGVLGMEVRLSFQFNDSNFLTPKPKNCSALAHRHIFTSAIFHKRKILESVIECIFFKVLTSS